MTSQLPLNVQPRLPYERENFCLHEGVSSVWEAACEEAGLDRFTFLHISGEPRTGKTHLAVALTAGIPALHRVPARMVEGSAFSQFTQQYAVERQPEGEILIIDNFDRYVSSLSEGESGPFVALYESLRHRRGMLITLSRPNAARESYDQHFASRIEAAVIYEVSNPKEEEIPLLISQMALQRGVRLSERKVRYLVPRVGRDIPSIERYLNRMLHISSLRANKTGFSELSDAL